ncbi:MAG: AbrB/MazE/SpoVT family DNA-binding domain-containing protein [Clostridia bacterium]|nr:AbrB/MazE/SpoVT family DNA-binding domain-containing protein [Clostridia bacterium]
MRTTGIIRPVDKNGRVVIPMDLRKQLNVENEVDSFEIFTEDDKIILKKYEPSCIFCGEAGDTLKLKGHNVCLDCIDRLQKIKNTINE